MVKLWEAAQGINLEITVIDDGSIDGIQQYLEEKSSENLRLILNTRNVGFAAANNQGLAIANAPVILLLSSDAFVTSETLKLAMRTIQYNPYIGLIGVKILNPDGIIQAESCSFRTLWNDIRVSAGLVRLDRKWSEPHFANHRLSQLQPAAA